MSPKTSVASAVALLALAAPASALAGPYDKGPAPTAANLVSPDGPYTVKKTSINDAATPGFGAGTIWSPGNAAPGETFGAVAVIPGWTEVELAIKWLGPHLASKGFVVVTFNPNNTLIDLPLPRGKQLNSALAYLSSSANPVRSLVDPERLGVVGHSMGGGGTLEAARLNAKIDATVGLAPWNTASNWSDLKAPSMIIGAENDFIAPLDLHAKPFYNSLAPSLPKAYMTLKGADHFTTNAASDSVGAATTAWLKRYVDGDTRYTSALQTQVLGSVAAKVKSYQYANIN